MPPTNTPLLSSAPPSPQTWTKPITLARHAYGDLYRASEMKIDQPGKCELVFTAKDTISKVYDRNFREIFKDIFMSDMLATALEKRGELDQNKELETFGRQLKEAAVKTVEGGIMTADLKKVTTIKNPHVVTGLVFIATVQERLMKLRG